MSRLTFLLILVLTIMLIATGSYCAPDDPDSDDKCDFDRLLRCIQHSRGARDITFDDDFKLSFLCKCSAKRFIFLASTTDYTFLSDMFVRSDTK